MYSLIHFSDQFQLPTYFLIISLAYTLCTYWIFERARRLNLRSNTAMDLSLAIMVGGLIGSRLVHIFFEYPEYYLENPWRAFQVWQGGFVFYGGLVGGILGGLIVAKIKRENVLNWMDAFAPLIPVGYAVGRLGCFLTGCCYGRECDLPWAVQFPDEVGNPPSGAYRHPVQIYDLLISLFIFVILRLAERYRLRLPQKLQQPGSLFVMWMFLYSLSRIVIEDFRDDYRGPPILGLSISTLVSLLTFATAIGFFLRRIKLEFKI